MSGMEGLERRTEVLIEKELWAVSRGGLQTGMKSLGCKRFGEYPSPQETKGQNYKKRVCGSSIPCPKDEKLENIMQCFGH